MPSDAGILCVVVKRDNKAWHQTMQIILHENFYLQSKENFFQGHINIVFNRLFSYLLTKEKYGKCDLSLYFHTS